jgi:predicted ATPase
VETHSDIVLTRMQWNVATGRLRREDVIAHWATRDADGMTTVTSREPDRSGAFGDWPADFADVAAEVDREYVEAANQQLSLPEK